MKRFLKKRWHSIPVAMVSVLLVLALVAGGAFAVEASITTPQTITQTIVTEYDYGTITAPAIELPNVKVGDSLTKTYSNAVTVVLGPDGEGKALRMVCDADSKYALFDVTITLKSKPVDSKVGLYGYGITAGGEVAIDLDVEGTYIFDQTLLVTAGNSTGTATSTITFTLEESTTPPGP